MALFKRKQKTVTYDPPAAAERLNVEIRTAIARAESRGVSAATILTAMKNAIAAKEYIDAVTAKSSYDFTTTIEKIG
jgi:hypothetical protein